MSTLRVKITLHQTRREVQSSGEWSTHLKGCEFHSAIFHPPDRGDSRVCVEAIIPEYFRQHYIDRGGSCRVRQVAPRSKLILLMLREGCELALTERGKLVIHTKIIQELNQSIRWLGRHFPLLTRVALEHDYEGAIGRGL
jgi:hypothetical protein